MQRQHQQFLKSNQSRLGISMNDLYADDANGTDEKRDRVPNCLSIIALIESAEFLGSGGNKIAFRSSLDGADVVLKVPHLHENASERFPPTYWRTKAMRAFESERIWLSSLSGRFALRFYGSNLRCDRLSATIVEYVPVNVADLIPYLLPDLSKSHPTLVPCLLLHVAVQLLHLLRWLDKPEPATHTGQRSIALCDWKIVRKNCTICAYLFDIFRCVLVF